jgi:hypothetical protein
VLEILIGEVFSVPAQVISNSEIGVLGDLIIGTFFVLPIFNNKDNGGYNDEDATGNKNSRFKE